MVKNKLYKHHKSKAALLMRNFTIGFSSLLMILGLAAIPTYISASNVSEAKANETLKEEDDSGEKEKESELLHINLD